MRFKKLYPDVELPEKHSALEYINVRANERIDVCSGNEVRVATGIYVSVAKNETAKLVGPNVVKPDVTTGELFVTIYNPDERNFMIYPGMVLAEILVEKKPGTVKSSTRKRKTAKFTSSAKVVKGEKK